MAALLVYQGLTILSSLFREDSLDWLGPRPEEPDFCRSGILLHSEHVLVAKSSRPAVCLRTRLAQRKMLLVLALLLIEIVFDLQRATISIMQQN